MHIDAQAARKHTKATLSYSADFLSCFAFAFPLAHAGFSSEGGIAGYWGSVGSLPLSPSARTASSGFFPPHAPPPSAAVPLCHSFLSALLSSHSFDSHVFPSTFFSHTSPFLEYVNWS